jgi:hypothetical protein
MRLEDQSRRRRNITESDLVNNNNNKKEKWGRSEVRRLLPTHSGHRHNAT